MNNYVGVVLKEQSGPRFIQVYYEMTVSTGPRFETYVYMKAET